MFFLELDEVSRFSSDSIVGDKMDFPSPCSRVMLNRMEAVILSIGDELILGRTIDTNAAWLSRQLARDGVRVLRHVTVPDETAAIADALRHACRQAQLVVMTGGLGPTPDDLTRQALAEAMGVPLECRDDYVPCIRAFFEQRGRSMPEANVSQAYFPAGSEPIDNPCGTAPGIRAVCGHAIVFALPGVPREMQEMYRQHIAPFVVQTAGGAALLETTLHCYGAGESDIAGRLAELMSRDRPVRVGTSAQHGIITVRVWAAAASSAEARLALDDTVAEIRRRLGTLIYGTEDETIPVVVGRLLQERNKTLATAESCTGGLIAKMITDVPGSSGYFLQGVVAYANEAKTILLDVPPKQIAAHGAVSEPVAHAMAVGCRHRSNADLALSVTGIAGPSGGSADKPVGLVYIGLADRFGVEVTEHRFGAFLDRQEIRRRAALTALNRLRLRLIQGR